MIGRARWYHFFLAGFFSPLLAILCLPPEYGFFGATPHSLFGQVRLFAAQSILFGGFAICAYIAVRMSVIAFRERRLLYLLLPLIVLFHPFFQPIFLERLDTSLNLEWGGKARSLDIIGMSPSEVEAVLGPPHQVNETSTVWLYKPLPFYWYGSRGEVFFTDGVVSSIDVNDD